MISWEDVEILKIYFPYILKYIWEEPIAAQSCGKINNVLLTSSSLWTLNAVSTKMCWFPFSSEKYVYV